MIIIISIISMIITVITISITISITIAIITMGSALVWTCPDVILADVRCTFANMLAMASTGYREVSWLRTNGVSTNGAAAKVMNFDGLRKKVHTGTFGRIKVG